MQKSLVDDRLFREVYGKHLGNLSILLKHFFEYIHFPFENILLYQNDVPLNIVEEGKKEKRSDILVELETMFLDIEAFSYLSLSGIRKTYSYMSTIYGTQTLEGKDYNQNKKMVVLIIADKVNKDLE